jgi:putative SOS response-associated peptidase YedK
MVCNNYHMKRATAEIADLFRAIPDPGVNCAADVYPGYTGMVVAEGVVRSMTWGFPLVLTGKRGQPLKPKAVNNAREDKLQTAFWRDSFVNRRCLIPVDAWAEADGEPGRMTKTWFSLPGEETFAVAGLWRETQEWGAAYSMVMVEGCPQMADVNDRMPVVLGTADWDRWTLGAPEEAFGLCHTCPLGLIVDRTDEPWGKPRITSPGDGLFAR